MKPAVLYITYDGLSDPLGQSQIIPYLEGLSEEFDISILSCEKSERLRNEKTGLKKKLAESGIDWQYVVYHKKPAIFSTFYDLRMMRAIAKRWNSRKLFRIIHCRSILAFLIGVKLKRSDNRLIFDFRGFWAEERVDGGLWDRTNIIHYQLFNRFKKAQVMAYHKADAIVSLTQAAKKQIVKDYGLSPKKISVIPCTADQSHFIPRSELLKATIDLREELNIEPSELVIGYVGSLGTRYQLNEMLDCFKVLLEKRPDSIFLIITISPLDELKALIREKGIAEKVIVTTSSYQKVPQYMALMDIGLFFIKPADSGAAVSPTKQAEFLSMGIPVVTNAGIGDSKKLIHDHKLGWVVEEPNQEAYREIADQIDNLVKLSSEEIIKIAKRKLSLKSGIKTYRSIYQSF